MLAHFFSVSLPSALFTTGGVNIRALIVVCRYLGDVLLATSLARSLVQKNYAVDWLVSPGTQDILEKQSYAHTVYTVDATAPWYGQLNLGLRLRRKYDAAFVLTASDRSMALAYSASSKIYALIPARGKQHAWKRYISNQWIPYEEKHHMVWNAIHLGQKAGLPMQAHIAVEWTARDTQFVCKQLPWGEEDIYIHIHPFARWAYKWWNQESWRGLITLILNADIRIVITASPAEEKQAFHLAKGYDKDKVCVLAGKLNWRQLACLSRHAAAYVGLDTANTHLAASTDTPVIALFGPTDPRIWGPYPNTFDGRSPWQARSKDGIQRSGNISLLQGTQRCIPCQLEGCDQHANSDSACLQDMQAQQVWQEIQKRLGLII